VLFFILENSIIEVDVNPRRKRKNNIEIQAPRIGYRFSGSPNRSFERRNKEAAFASQEAFQGFPFEKRASENGGQKEEVSELPERRGRKEV
jgi:hypothetical protein